MANRQSLKNKKERQAREQKAKYMSRKVNFSTFRKVWHYARPYRKYMYLTFLFDMINAVCELLVPIFMGYAINCAVGQGNVDFNGILVIV